MKLVRYSHGCCIGFGALEVDSIQPYTKAPWLGGELRGNPLNRDEVKILAPCEPSKVISVAINYSGTTGSDRVQEEPLVFLKAPSSVVGPSDQIVCPFKDTYVWGEPELGLLIGTRLKNASLEEARRAVFGYFVANDVTCENVNGWDHHLARAKSSDTFCVIGNYVDTSFRPTDQIISGSQNGQVIRRGALSDRLFSDSELLSSISTWMTLEPGDILLTGTPPRLGGRAFLKNGDRYRCEIEKLDLIDNVFGNY